jgi:hypothetical protein
LSVFIRLLVVTGLLAVIGVVAQVAANQMYSTEVVLPEAQLEAMPLKFGPWEGEEKSLDSRVFVSLGAAWATDRVYRNAPAPPVMVHVAAFTDPEMRTPHAPQLCYKGAGWTAAGSKDVKLPGPDGSPVRLLTYKREGETIQVLYCYQLGQGTAVDYGGVRELRWAYLGHSTRPPLLKVMLQTDVQEPGEAEKSLRDIGGRVLAWTRELPE